jgi:elongation factor Ts
MTTKTISAKDVAALRARTGAGMMDCKKALEESGGDVDAAVESLRKRGIAKAEKRADRSTSEGLIGAEVRGTVGVLVELNCETDFVARNDDFGAVLTSLVEQMFASGAADTAAFLASMRNGQSVDEYVKLTAGKTGEAVQVRRVARVDAGATGQVGVYRHHNGKLAALVAITTPSAEVAANAATVEVAKYVAEHVAAAAPLAVDRTGVPADKLDSERRIAEEQARQTGKPEAMIEKIAAGKIEAFLKDVTLLPQAWVRDGAKTIGDLVTEHGKAAGGDLSVASFVRFQLGVD